MEYGISKTTVLSYDQAIEKVTDALKQEGFGILTTIDVRETFKKKLDVDFERYIILGACNPPFAHRALLAERDLGLLLPCNVIVYEHLGKTHVSAFDPLVMGTLLDNPEVQRVAEEVEVRLRRVIDAV